MGCCWVSIRHMHLITSICNLLHTGMATAVTSSQWELVFCSESMDAYLWLWKVS